MIETWPDLPATQQQCSKKMRGFEMTQTASLGEILGRMSAATERGEAPMTELQAQARARDLKDRFEVFTRPTPEFKVGDLIKLRDDIFSPYSKPRTGEPVIVLQTDGVEVQLIDHNHVYRKADVLIGLVDNDGDCLRFAIDPFYFDPYTGPQ